MRYKKPIQLFVLIVVLLCYTTGYAIEIEDLPIPSVPTFFECSISKELSVSAIVNCPFDESFSSVSVLTARLMPFATNCRLTDFSTLKVISTYEETGDNDFFYYEFLDNSFLKISDSGTIYFYTEDGKRIEQLIGFAEEAAHEYDPGNLAFLALDDAETRISSFLSDRSVSNIQLYKSFCMDNNSLAKLTEQLRDANSSFPDGKVPYFDDLSTDHSFYFFQFQQVFYEVPVLLGDMPIFSQNDNAFLPGNKIDCAIDKNGIAFLDIEGVYSDIEVLETVDQVLSLRSGLEAVENYLSEIISPEPQTIYRIAFEYIPCKINQSGNQYKLVPSWHFYSAFESVYMRYPQNLSQYPATQHYFVDAITGELIII